MTNNFKLFLQGLAAFLFIVAILSLNGCTQTLQVLDGATHACGNMHVEGYFTDTQGDVVIAKAPPEWSPDQVKEFDDYPIGIRSAKGTQKFSPLILNKLA